MVNSSTALNLKKILKAMDMASEPERTGTMKSSRAEEGDMIPVVTTLVAQLGVGGLISLIAEITEQQSDYFLLSGERQKANQCMRDFRILQRALDMLGH
jgi:hypothetical protein